MVNYTISCESDYLKMNEFKQYLSSKLKNKKPVNLLITYYENTLFESFQIITVIIKYSIFKNKSKFPIQFTIYTSSNSLSGKIDLLLGKMFNREKLQIFDKEMYKYTLDNNSINNLILNDLMLKDKTIEQELFEINILITLKEYDEKPQTVSIYTTKLFNLLTKKMPFLKIDVKKKISLLFTELANNALLHSQSDCFFNILITDNFFDDELLFISFAMVDFSNKFIYTNLIKSFDDHLEGKKKISNEVEIYNHIDKYSKFESNIDKAMFCSKLIFEKGVSSKDVSKRKWGKGLSLINETIKTPDIENETLNSIYIYSGSIRIVSQGSYLDSRYLNKSFKGTITTGQIVLERKV